MQISLSCNYLGKSRPLRTLGRVVVGALLLCSCLVFGGGGVGAGVKPACSRPRRPCRSAQVTLPRLCRTRAVGMAVGVLSAKLPEDSFPRLRDLQGVGSGHGDHLSQVPG